MKYPQFDENKQCLKFDEIYESINPEWLEDEKDKIRQQALKDAFPYLVGAVRDDVLIIEQRLEKEINELKLKISKSTKEELMAAKTAVINSYMNQEWKHSLDLEDEDAIIHFDPKRMQIYSISQNAEKYVPLDEMCSGANWVGMHLLVHFALHKFFAINDRPIPRYLMIDQPSQIYFPSDGGECKDVEAVKRMFKFIIDRTNEMNGDLQVILTEHANFSEDEFRQYVVERWYIGEKLIPEDWYNNRS